MDAPTQRTDDCFAGIDWSALNLGSSEHGCAEQARIVKGWLDGEENAERNASLGVLRALLSMSIYEIAAPQTACVHGLPRVPLVVLVGLLGRIESLEVRTRIADAAWSHGRACSVEIARQCVREYVKLARDTYEPRAWVTSFLYLKRALSIGLSLGRKHEAFVEASTAALEMLCNASTAEPGYFSMRMIDLLLELRIGNPAEIGALASRIADGAEAHGDLSRTRDYLQRAASSWQRAREPDLTHQARRRIGELLEREATPYRAQPAGMMHAAVLLEEAITVYRSVPGGGADADRLKPDLQQVRAAAVAAMPRTELARFDQTELIEYARNHVKGRTSRQALLQLVTLTKPIDIEDLRRAAAEALRNAPLASAVASLNLKRSGQLVHRTAGTLDPDEEAGTIGRMHQHLNMYRQIAAIGINAARDQVQLEHGLAEADFFYLAKQSSFVPEGREPMFAKGLAFGADADFISAAHLLNPQLEHALRVHLNAIGVVTLNLPSSGAQDERDLGALLELPELRRLLDDAVIFDWRSLLTEKAGANLRNELSHGLIEPGDRTAEFIYLWWTTLRSVAAPTLLCARTQNSNDGEHPTQQEE
jgi:hypothetical protein